MVMSDIISVTLKSGEVVEILRYNLINGSDNSMENLVNECVEEMQKDTNNVLLMSRDIKNDILNQMVEIVFKEQ